MVLTPDQKKRIAALDTKPAEDEDESQGGASVLSARFKALALSLRTSSFKSIAIKFLIACGVFAVAGFFVVEYQLGEIDFKAVISSGRGSPVTRLKDAVKLQRDKTILLGKGRGQLMGGEYEEALETAVDVMKLSPGDIRAQKLVDDTVEAVTQKAIQEFESGDISIALADVRLALKYNSEHKAATELYMDISDRLLIEAQAHQNKGENADLIKKAQEVLRIDPSNMAARNLLVKTKSQLLDKAGELYISKRYFESLNMVRLALQIDPDDAEATRLLNQISTYIETPKVELFGIIKRGNVLYARIQLSDSGKVEFVKKGDRVQNFKVLRIDSENKLVELLQVHTGQKFTIQQVSAT